MNNPLFPVICCMLLSFASCSKDSLHTLSGDLPFTVETPETKVTIDISPTGQDFDFIFFMNPSDIDGCAYFCLITKELNPALFFYLKDDSMTAGSVPVISRLDFGIMYSNNSEDYTSKIESGKVYVKERSDDMVVLRFKKVCFKIAAGRYIFNGDITFPLRNGI